MSKKILFIAPNFFEYHNFIKKELEDQGYLVDWFDDRPNPNLIEKCLLRVKPSLLNKKIEDYFYKEILEQVKKQQYDIVLVILGQCINESMCKDLKKVIPHAFFVMYLWDSIKNFPQCLNTSKHFDKVFSFDKLDCEKYGFNFMPLFYTYGFKNFDKEQTCYDVSCICTVKKGKYNYIKNIKNELDKKFSNNFFYLYLQSKIVWIYNKIKLAEFKKTSIKEFFYKKVSYENTLKIFNKSRIVLDVQMQNQNGLTMRTFEALALGKKIITTNESIKNYEFYNSKWIYIYSGEKINFDDEFFSYDFDVAVDIPNFEKYSIKNWVKKLLD